MNRLHIFSSRDNGRETTGNSRLPVRVSWLLCCLLAASLFAGFLPTFSSSFVSPAYAARMEGEEAEPFIEDPASVPTEAPSVPDRGLDKSSVESTEGADGESAEDASTGGESAGEVGVDAEAQSDAEAQAQAVVLNDGISIDLSEPETWQEGDTVFYKTTVTVKGTESFFGYQIQVEAENEESIEVVDSFGGLKTAPVYKDGSVYLASMAPAQVPEDVSTQDSAQDSEEASTQAASTQTSAQTTQAGLTRAANSQVGNDAATCEIIAKYPVSDSNPDKQLVVRSFQVVKSLSPEAIITLGPDPAAAVLDLTPTSDPIALVAENQVLLVIALALGVSGAGAAVAVMLRRRVLAKAVGRHAVRPK